MTDKTEGSLDRELKYAEEIGTESLKNIIKSFEKIDETNGSDTIITNDFAPHSFYFERYSKETTRFLGNGGIIFHSLHDRGGDGGSPTFSVSMNNDTNSHWEVHT